MPGSVHVPQTVLGPLGLELVSCEVLQTLWAGYGHVCALRTRVKNAEAVAVWRHACYEEGSTDTEEEMLPVILKSVEPPLAARSNDEGHLRKMLSYEVEQYFYTHVAPRLAPDVALAYCLATEREEAAPNAGARRAVTSFTTVMTDLRLRFPVAGTKKASLTPRQVRAALTWLADFHGASWRWRPRSREAFLLPPLEEQARRRREEPDRARQGLWLNGGYTYLATRRQEYEALGQEERSEWQAAFCTPVPGAPASATMAELLARVLSPHGRAVESLIHGDVKSENLFSTHDGSAVAFCDFQYVGLGLGVCDLAKLFTCSVPQAMLAESSDEVPAVLGMGRGERALLEAYRAGLLLRRRGDAPPPAYAWEVFARHWEAALADWCRFQASWGFWGNTAWLQARVRSILSDGRFVAWLLEEEASMANVVAYDGDGGC